MRKNANPPWWWKPWLTPWFAFQDWRDRPRIALSVGSRDGKSVLGRMAGSLKRKP